MKRIHCVGLILMLVLILGVSLVAEAADNRGAQKALEAASKSIDEGNLDASIKKLEGIKQEGLTNENLSRLHFLKGKATYIKMITEVRQCRADGTQPKSELQEHQVEPFRNAMGDLQKSYELSPDSDWAPEALYATGLIQGYGCLQRFKDARDTFKILMDKYPNTDLGKAAAKKFNVLNSSLRGKGHGRKTHP